AFDFMLGATLGAAGRIFTAARAETAIARSARLGREGGSGVARPPTGARYVVDSAGQTRIVVRHGTLEISSHAARRITQRGLTVDIVDAVVSNQAGFKYWHGGLWKVGYYDPTTRVFVGTVDNVVTTVINNVSPNYIRNLMAAHP
ncbi:MAG TPA: hypothetical protein DGG94_17480, partial [Micromonosporaceae bacterium]|nr:hypothetical protein [Micromonosporaceae bacterium]